MNVIPAPPSPAPTHAATPGHPHPPRHRHHVGGSVTLSASTGRNTAGGGPGRPPRRTR